MTENLKRRLSELEFNNRFVNELPGDPELNNGRRQVFEACYSRVLPAPVVKPTMIAHASEVGELLDLNPEEFGTAETAVAKLKELAFDFIENRLHLNSCKRLGFIF